jgi:FkbM family methyltransferase
MSLFRPAVAEDAPLVRLPWGAVLEVNAHEVIGQELIRQNIFDIAVSETVWRLLRPGDRAVDVGANIGYLTSLCAARVGAAGAVDAFEPHPRVLARLRRNVGRLSSPPWGSVRLHDCALGRHDGYARLFEPEGFGANEGTSTMVARPGATPSGDGTGLEVRVARLDGLLVDGEIRLMKVDVEGFEAEVFAGAQRLLEVQRIANIVYEAHDCERSPLHAMLAQHGYSIFGIGYALFGPNLTPGNAAPRIDRRWESPSYLATRDPDATLAALRRPGWQVLRSC